MGLQYKFCIFDLAAYQARVLPAYQAFMKNDDPQPIITLLTEMIARLDSGRPVPYQQVWNRSTINEAIGILNGSVLYDPWDEEGAAPNQETTRRAKRYFVKENLACELVLTFCVRVDLAAHAENGESGSAILSYLSDQSKRIEDLLARTPTPDGGPLEITIGEWSDLLTRQEVMEFREELAKIPPPDGNSGLQQRSGPNEVDALVELRRRLPEDMGPKFDAQYYDVLDRLKAGHREWIQEERRKLVEEYHDLATMVGAALDDPDLTLLLILE